MPVRVSTIDDLDLSRWVQAGDTVTWAQACAEPSPLTARLMAQRAAIGAFGVFIGLGIEPTVTPEHAERVSVKSYTGAGPNGALSRAGRLEILPSHYSDYPRLIASGRLPIDVVLVQLSPADNSGRHSLSLGDEWISAALDRARVVIAEVNAQAPWTDARRLHEAEIDVIVETDRPPVELHRRQSGEVERRIAEHVRDLIPDGATLQMGLGALPEAILGALRDHRELGVHSGAIGDAVVELIQRGVITNAKKSSDPGVTVAGSLMGTKRLFAFAHRNRLVRVRDIRYTHDPARLAAQPSLVAINSAFEVDLTGQINAEFANGAYLGAVGGSMDFLRNAARAPGGVPIIALPSRARDRGRIVAELSGPVTTPRADAGIIVTEFGATDLRGLTLGQRRPRMIEIAHPDDREALETAAAQLER